MISTIFPSFDCGSLFRSCESARFSSKLISIFIKSFWTRSFFALLPGVVFGRAGVVFCSVLGVFGFGFGFDLGVAGGGELSFFFFFFFSGSLTLRLLRSICLTCSFIASSCFSIFFTFLSAADSSSSCSSSSSSDSSSDSSSSWGKAGICAHFSSNNVWTASAILDTSLSRGLYSRQLEKMRRISAANSGGVEYFPASRFFLTVPKSIGRLITVK
eukprot:Lithocolla_globosa_v1_NODE_2029_length_2201_cov_6.760951.p2 type:complete len:215 gc:universal NODE_2029_length_2201_cov_6.760951:457-1101(+)